MGTLYTLRAIPSRSLMGFNHATTSYVVAFQHKKHARLVWSFAHEATPMQIKLLNMKNITSQVEEVCKVPHGTFDKVGLPQVHADFNAKFCISKKPNINKLGCTLEEMTDLEYMALPFQQNIGVVMPRKIIEHTQREIIFESEVIDPVQDIDLFKRMLLDSKSHL
jgi:hypothetical protein